MNSIPIRDYLSEHAASNLNLEGLNGTFGSPEHLLQLVLNGKAKLPLDKVEDVAAFIGCDAQGLFRLPLQQFYHDDNIQLLERMFGEPERNPAEEAWLSLIRRATGRRLKPPSQVGRRLVAALLRGRP